MIYVGIDPGLDGAIAVIDILRNETQVWSTPTLTVTRSHGEKREYNEQRVRSMMQGLLSRVDNFPMKIECALEAVHSMPGQGVRSMFSMGQGFGLWRGFLAMAGVPYKLVAPQTWKKYHGLLGADKEASRLLALQSYPQMAPVLARKKDHGRAEALLLAEYARRLHKVAL